MKIAIAFQPDLFSIMKQFSIFHETLRKHVATATEKSGGVLAHSIEDHQHWENPSGVLENSFGVVMINEFSAYVGSPVAYAPRRNWGFDGPDSLGRVYHDEGAFFVEAAIEDDDTLLEIAGNYVDAVYAAWNECVGALPPGISAVMGIV